MKKFELAFNFLHLPLDWIAIVLAGFTAYSLRFTDYMRSIRPVMFNIPWHQYWPVVLIVAGAWLIIFAITGLYNIYPQRRMARDFWRIIFACSTGFAGITIYVFFTLQKFDSRFLVLIGWILAIIYVLIGRLIMIGLKRLFYSAGIGQSNVVIIGMESVAETIKEAFISRPALGYKIIDNFANFDPKIAKEILKNKPDEIIYTVPQASEKEVLEIIDFANEYNIAFKYSADLFETISANMTINTIAGIPIIELGRTRLTGWGRIFKRISDIIGACFFIIILSPIYLITAIVILLETGRPIFYKNERVGAKGKKFNVLKFRSMHQQYCTGQQFEQNNINAKQYEEKLIATQNTKTGPVYKIANDPRITKFGGFIRRWSIDELPQFFNVLIGNMSIVGPRPHQPREVEKYEKHHKIVLAIKPGITGMAQISGRSNLSFEEEIKLDAFYVEKWSLLIDLIILIKTPFIVLKRKGAW